MIKDESVLALIRAQIRTLNEMEKFARQTILKCASQREVLIKMKALLEGKVVGCAPEEEPTDNVLCFVRKDGDKDGDV